MYRYLMVNISTKELGFHNLQSLLIKYDNFAPKGG